MKTAYWLIAIVSLSALLSTAIPLAAEEQRTGGARDTTVYVTFWFDTEDSLLPQADDAAKRLAEMFSRRGVQATFKIVGEKARVLLARLSYVDLGTRTVSAAEGLLALSHFVAGSEGDRRADKIELEFAYGPASAPQRFLTEGMFRPDAVRQAAQELIEIVRQTKQLPAVVWVEGEPLRPEDFAVTLAALVASEHCPEVVPLQRGEPEARKSVADDSPRLWGWVIFPKDFTAPRMMELAKLQAWTIKPAVLRRAN